MLGSSSVVVRQRRRFRILWADAHPMGPRTPDEVRSEVPGTQTTEKEGPIPLGAPCSTSASLDALCGADQQLIRGPLREQAHGHHSGDLVELTLEGHRIGDGQAVDVENLVAVIGDEALAPHGATAAGRECASDE